MYNASHGETFVSLGEYQSSGGLARLGEHYISDVKMEVNFPALHQPSLKLRLASQLYEGCPPKHHRAKGDGSMKYVISSKVSLFQINAT